MSIKPLDEGKGSVDLWSVVRFDSRGLVPVVVVCARSNEVLMHAWMNRTALERTLTSGEVTYFSRSRNELWRKGASSGHRQRLCSMRIDCDGDTLLLRVAQTGVACHSGRMSCFYRVVEGEGRVVLAEGS